MGDLANSFELVRTVVADLSAADLGPLVFGGWAEELLGLAPPRTHSDIDLLVVAEAQAVEVFVSRRHEIVQKRFSHKRAYVEDGVVVELFLVDRHEGVDKTTFWDTRLWTWPSLEPVMVDGLPVAPAAALAAYRTHYDDIAGARITSP